MDGLESAEEIGTPDALRHAADEGEGTENVRAGRVRRSLMRSFLLRNSDGR